MRHRVLKRYCRNVRQDRSLMNLVFYYENDGLCQPYNPDQKDQAFVQANSKGSPPKDWTPKKIRNRKKSNSSKKTTMMSDTKKASDDKTKRSTEGQSRSTKGQSRSSEGQSRSNEGQSAASSSKAKQPWWKANKSDKKENGKIKRR